MSDFDINKAQEELRWLQDHPWFEEKPASMPEFLGPDYLNIDKGIRPGVRAELYELFGTETNGHRIAVKQEAMFTGAIGIGKTTMASIVLPYMCHWILCLKDPQDFYDLLPGSRIAFMMMSTSEGQAKETVFGDVKARIQYSPWFQNNYTYDPKFTNQIRFAQKDIWILPGNSAETTFEGYNILGGILDEADSHKKTDEKDYAEVGFDTIKNRVESRFQDRGFILVVGQMKSTSGFAHKKYKELKQTEKETGTAHVVRMTIWESLGWEKFLDENGERDSFFYDVKRKEVIPKGSGLLLGKSENLIEIPRVYEQSFRNNPEKALRDQAGIPPAAGDPFISLTYRIDEAVEKWQERYKREDGPVNDDPTRPQIADWFQATTGLRHASHVDLAYSSAGDAAGLAMGHVEKVVDVDGEKKPYIVIDLLMRIKAPPGTEIMLSDVRHVIYDLRDERHFKIKDVTADGFQSTEFKQQLRKRRFQTSYLSVDKSKLPYTDLRDALYESRLELPPYLTYLKKGDTERVQIAVKELMELEEGDKMIDHPADGSKDVADCIAGVVHTLMGDRSYRRSSREAHDDIEQNQQNLRTGTDGYVIPTAPVPPSMPGYMADIIPLPSRLRRR